MFYSEDLVEEIRQRNDIVDVISAYVRLQKKGSNYMGLCPFHNEKTPSFSVSREKQMYYCFGCGVGGNVVTFLMEYENYSFVEALKALADRGGIAIPEMEYNKAAKQQADQKTQLLEVNKQAAKYYYYQLGTEAGSTAKKYLLARNLTEDMIRKFGLGYASQFSSSLYRYLKERGYSDELLRESGLITMEEAKGVYDKFWNRVMFPIMDINNRVIGFGGRVLGDGMPKYLNSPETKLFDKSRNLYGLNFARLERSRKILLCEGYMDVITLHQAGFTNAVASLGTAFTGLQANLLKRYADEIYITFDSDGAGTKASLRAIPILREAGLSAKVIHMEPYKDPDEFIKNMGEEAFSERMKDAENSFFFEIHVLEREYDLKDPEQKTKFFNEVAKKLLVFTEELERNNYMEAVAAMYFIRYEDLRKLVNRYGARMSLQPEKEPVGNEYSKHRKKEEGGPKQSQKILLTWLIEDTRLFEKLRGIIGPDDFLENLYHKAAAMLFEEYEREKKVTPAKIINQFESKEEQNLVAGLFNVEFREEMNAAERERAINDTVLKIKKASLDQASRKAQNLEELQLIVGEQAKLEKLHISLQDG